jgi:hypothetical protein
MIYLFIYLFYCLRNTTITPGGLWISHLDNMKLLTKDYSTQKVSSRLQ